MRSCTGIDNAGFLATLLCLLSLGSLAEAKGRSYAPFPDPDAGYVTDRAGLLTPEQERQIERLLGQTEERRGVEIIVVTIRSMKDYPGTPNRSIEEFARALFNAYGIGNRPKNDGVLLLVAAQDRQAKIELGAGYGRTRDKDADRIMASKIVPRFRRGQYAEGVTGGVEALVKEFGGMRLLPGWLPWAVGGAIVVSIPVTVSLFRNGKRGWGWVVVGLTIVLVLALIWLIREMHEATRGRGGYAQPGGLGGFGGGFSGGGGATGSW